MENENEYPENEKPEGQQELPGTEKEEELEFENPSIDPGFDTTYESEEETTFPDKASAEEQKPVEDNDKGNDALNYNNDRENGAYNPKNI
jgi:hypothetical protein